MEFKTSIHYYQFELSEFYIDNDNNDSNVIVRESWLGHPPTQKNINFSMLGLFSNKKIKCNDIICQYNGKYLNTKDALQLNDKSYLMRIGEQCYIDASQSPHCIARYINDCKSTSGYNVRFEKSLNEKCAWVVAIRDIEPNEELFANYGKFYWASSKDYLPITLSITDLAILKKII